MKMLHESKSPGDEFKSSRSLRSGLLTSDTLDHLVRVPPTWMRCRVSTATGLLSLMLSVNQVMLTTCMLGRSSGARSFSHAHSAEAWLLSDTT